MLISFLLLFLLFTVGFSSWWRTMGPATDAGRILHFTPLATRKSSELSERDATITFVIEDRRSRAARKDWEQSVVPVIMMTTILGYAETLLLFFWFLLVLTATTVAGLSLPLPQPLPK